MFYHWLYGMEWDKRTWHFNDISLWLISIGILYLITGRMAEKENVSEKYLHLHRYGCYSKWWRMVCLRQLVVVIVYVAGSASLIGILNYVTRTKEQVLVKSMGIDMMVACGLFFLNCGIMVLIQTLLIFLFHKLNLVFTFMIGYQLIGLYGGQWCLSRFCMGNYGMYLRTIEAGPHGFSIGITIAWELILLVLLVLLGGKVLSTRR